MIYLVLARVEWSGVEWSRVRYVGWGGGRFDGNAEPPSGGRKKIGRKEGRKQEKKRRKLWVRNGWVYGLNGVCESQTGKHYLPFITKELWVKAIRIQQ